MEDLDLEDAGVITLVLPHTTETELDRLDPFEESSCEQALSCTARGLIRVATVAAHAAQRFERDEPLVDPVAWMLTPHPLFNDRPALLACSERLAFARAIIAHGILLQSDATPEELDDLLLDNDRDVPPFGWSFESLQGQPSIPRGGRRLYSAVLDLDGLGESLAFCAMVANSGEHVAEELRLRFGDAAVDSATIIEGVDRSDPRVSDLVATSLLASLAEVEAEPFGRNAGFDLTVERWSL